MIYSLIREEWRTTSKRHGHFAQVKRDGFKEIAPQLLSKCALRVFSGTRPSMGLDEQEEE